MKDTGASYSHIAQRVGCSTVPVKKVVQRRNQNSVARKPGTGPSRWTTAKEDRRIVKVTVANRRMTATGIWKQLQVEYCHEPVGTGCLRMDYELVFPCSVYFWHNHTDSRNLSGVEPRRQWHSVMFTDESSQIDANVSVDELVKGHIRH